MVGGFRSEVLLALLVDESVPQRSTVVPIGCGTDRLDKPNLLESKKPGHVKTDGAETAFMVFSNRFESFVLVIVADYRNSVRGERYAA